MMDILIGADPELFLMQDGVPLPATGIVPGTKDEPFPVEKGAVQRDGMAAEFNIEPAANFNEFDGNIDAVLAALYDMIPPGVTTSFKPTATFTKDVMAVQPEDALMLGCDPDFNAYTLEPNPAPQPTSGMRTAGGHVHIGWCDDADINDPVHVDACAQLTRQLDYYLGLPSLFEDRDTERRRLYGRAGAFRPKEYGVEYRTLSNVWVGDKTLRRAVFNGVHLALENLLDGKEPYQLNGMDAARAINDSELRIAHILMDNCNIPAWR
jgi:hypothetical protein